MNQICQNLPYYLLQPYQVWTGRISSVLKPKSFQIKSKNEKWKKTENVYKKEKNPSNTILTAVACFGQALTHHLSAYLSSDYRQRKMFKKTSNVVFKGLTLSSTITKILNKLKRQITIENKGIWLFIGSPYL